MTTDLSKELGEIKRRLQETADFESENAREIANKAAFLPECLRLLSIIENEIPAMLRAAAEDFDSRPRISFTGTAMKNALAFELRRQATLIESLTNEKEKG